VFTFKSGVVFGLEVDVTRLKGDGDGGAFKLDTKERFKMLLNLEEVVMVFF